MDSADLKNGYDWTKLREKLHAGGVRLLIEHRTFRLVDHAHNARSDGPRYRQLTMCDPGFSAITRTFGESCVRDVDTPSSVNASRCVRFTRSRRAEPVKSSDV